jgi:hypothetical protein
VTLYLGNQHGKTALHHLAASHCSSPLIIELTSFRDDEAEKVEEKEQEDDRFDYRACFEGRYELDADLDVRLNETSVEPEPSEIDMQDNVRSFDLTISAHSHPLSALMYTLSYDILDDFFLFLFI